MSDPQVLAADAAAERGDLPEAERLLRAVIEDAPRRPNGFVLSVHCLCGLVRVLLQQRLFEEAEKALGEATQIVDRHGAAGSRLQAAVLSTVAHLRLEQGRPQPAQAILEHSRQILQSRPRSPTDPLLIDVPLLQAKAARQLGQYAEAERCLIEAIGVHAPRADREPRKAATLALHMATLRHAQGQIPEARASLSQAMEHAARAGPGAEILKCEALMVLGTLALAEKQYAQAEQHFRQLLDSRRSKLGPDHPLTTDAVNNLGIAVLRQGKAAAAESLFDQVLRTQQANSSPMAAQAITMNNLAVGYREQGRLDEAEAMQRRALQLQQDVLGAHHPSVANTLTNLALVLQKKRQFDAAREAAQRALRIANDGLGQDHQRTREIIALLESIGNHPRSIAPLSAHNLPGLILVRQYC